MPGEALPAADAAEDAVQAVITVDHEHDRADGAAVPRRDGRPRDARVWNKARTRLDVCDFLCLHQIFNYTCRYFVLIIVKNK